MAVRYGGGAELGTGQRIISSGGNVYTLSPETVKQGYATRGRGFWIGKKHADEDDPKVDDANEDAEVANALDAPEDQEDITDDGFNDDENPFVGMHLTKDKLKHADKERILAAKILAAAVMGPVKKAIPTLGEMKVDLLLQNPNNLSDEQLIQSSDLIKGLLRDPYLTGVERMTLLDHAGRVAECLKKAIGTKSSEEKVKQHKQPKSKSTKADAKGKTQYKYDKKGDGKGPNSDRAKGKAPAKAEQQEGAPQQGGDITPPPPIDPSAFAKKLGLDPEKLTNFAKKKTKADFVKFFTKREKLMQKTQATASFLAKLYDALVSPEPPAEETPERQTLQGTDGNPQAQAASMPKVGKGFIIFNGATLDRHDMGLMRLMKSVGASTIEDIRKCLQEYYECSASKSVKLTRTVINRWERQGLVDIYPED